MSQLPEADSWKEYRKLVLGEIRRLSDQVAALSEQISTLRVEVGRLQVKSGLWGALGGVVAVLTVILVSMLKR